MEEIQEYHGEDNKHNGVNRKTIKLENNKRETISHTEHGK
jgi:hypothetical protein